jgi:pimeloyl-ACP methyl ester carboxylesterase
MILRFTAALLFVSASSAPIPPATPCLTAGATCTEWIVLGGGPSRSLVYRTFPLDKRNDAITRVLVSIHGASRDADNYFRSTIAAGFLADALENTLIIAPRLASSDGAGCRDVLAPNEISWNCNSWRSGGPASSTPAVTSFDFLDEILRKVARKDLFPNLKTIVVVGHSAGGQVVNRYEMGNQIHDKLGVPITYIVSNPSSYAYPDSLRPTDAAFSVTAHAPGYIPAVAPNVALFRTFGDAASCTTFDRWPYGMHDRSGYTAKESDDQLRHQLASRPTVYLLGQLDILPLAGFDGSCAAMAQGPTRLARGEAFARFVNEKLSAQHTVTIIPLCGHNARCMYTSDVALPLLFPKQ